MHRSVKHPGFTIVELLIVIVVIGILAAVTIVAFNGVQRNAARSVVKNDLHSALQEIENHRTLNSTFPATADDVNNGRGLSYSRDTTYEYDYTTDTFCVTATSVSAQISYYYDSAEGEIAEGACTGHIGYSSTPGAGIHQLVSGGLNGCRVRDGVLYCWGANNFKQLGNGSTTNSSTPIAAVTAGGLLDGKVVTDMDVDYYHGCAIADATLYCWGWGYLGNGINYGTANDAVAVTTSGVLSGKTVTDVDVGYRRSCVIADGGVYCWGVGQNGNGGTFANSPVAVDTSGVLGGKTVTQVSVGSDFTCVLADGAPYCWGENNAGQLGNNSTVDVNTPVAVDTSGVLSGRAITKLEVGVGTTNSQACVLADGLPFCWGHGAYGALGNGGTANSSVPVAVTTSGTLSGRTITDIAVGQNTACVIADGRPFCWGYNIYGQLGINSTGPWNYTTPYSTVVSGVLSGKTLTDIALGEYQACAMDEDYAMYCWGRNYDGQLGNGSTSDSSVPVTVNALP